MFDQAVHVTMLYVSDGTQFLLFVVGLATLFEVLAHRTTHRLFVALTPRQVAAALAAQLAIFLLALLGFKFIVLSGGPGIATHHILKDGTFTRVFSAISMILATVLIVTGLHRLFKLLRRTIILERH